MKNLILTLKGMAMGGADVIPGVSGGTIALIAGIYDELIASIKSFDIKAIRLLLSFQIRELWKQVNGNFLLAVFFGIFLSIFSLAKAITYAMEVYPIPLWSFFFGLILVSVFYVSPTRIRPMEIFVLLIGTALAYFITVLAPAQTPEAYWFVFLSGAIAICAMILPGISGSFILLILGKYEFILNAVKSLDVGVILVFGLGCAIGLVSFSKLVSWLLSKYRRMTMAVLSGFMLGSLNKIWPWKLDEIGQAYDQETSNTFFNVWPAEFASATGQSSQLLLGTLFFILGLVLIVGLEAFGKKIRR